MTAVVDSTLYVTLHQHGINAAGMWVGLSYDGPIITGWSALAQTEDEVGAHGQAARRREGAHAMTEPVECVEVVITAESAEWLADFTRSLVEDRLVACGHNSAPIRSVYRGEGRVHYENHARVERSPHAGRTCTRSGRVPPPRGRR